MTTQSLMNAKTFVMSDNSPLLGPASRSCPSRDEFEEWLAGLDDTIELFIDELPEALSVTLDESPDSLLSLEAWLLNRYSGISALLCREEAGVLDGCAGYVGEVFRKHLGGIWTIELDQPDRAFYGLPILRGPWGEECSASLVTACLDRRTGHYMHAVFRNWEKIKNGKHSEIA